MPASPVTGLHHVTAIAGPAQRHLDFYAGRLGLRLVKRTVNFDDPQVYHLYYGDGAARPGSLMTAFPWERAHPGRAGGGQAVATAYAVPPGAIAGWLDRLAAGGFDAFDAPAERFGERVLALGDPDGLVLELVEDVRAEGGWHEGPIPQALALTSFHRVTLSSLRPEATVRLLTDLFGYAEAGEEGGRLRLVNEAAERARYLEVLTAPGAPDGRMGAGVVHHVAFRVPTDEAHEALRDALQRRGFAPTPVIDRQYFRSVYFREPGGVLFEVATDPPGMAIDEPADALGERLMLPPQYEPRRTAIEARLPVLRRPAAA
ncbi:MAG: ring-cleaving dioxygenase [Rubricoccaceae bacterium]